MPKISQIQSIIILLIILRAVTWKSNLSSYISVWDCDTSGKMPYFRPPIQNQLYLTQLSLRIFLYIVHVSHSMKIEAWPGAKYATMKQVSYMWCGSRVRFVKVNKQPKQSNMWSFIMWSIMHCSHRKHSLLGNDHACELVALNSIQIHILLLIITQDSYS